MLTAWLSRDYYSQPQLDLPLSVLVNKNHGCADAGPLAAYGFPLLSLARLAAQCLVTSALVIGMHFVGILSPSLIVNAEL